MKHPLTFAVVAISMFGAAGLALAAPMDQDSGEDDETDSPAETADAPDPDMLCLWVRQIRDHRVPEPGQLEFRIKANSFVKVHFQQECGSLTRRSLLSYRSVGSQLCRNDRIAVLRSLGTSSVLDDQCFVAGFSAVEK
ncbi:MAG: hypothetical protein AAFX04_11530 [Pseudomonadota bacterium]